MKTKTKIKHPPSESKSAYKIAEELEERAHIMLKIAQDLRGEQKNGRKGNRK